MSSLLGKVNAEYCKCQFLGITVCEWFLPVCLWCVKEE